MDPEEIEFLAENSVIDIVPNFNCGVIHLVSGDVGPFRGGINSEVPFWFAVHLKLQRKCTILPLFWLNVDYLEDLIQLEKNSKGFIKMPCEHYMIKAKILLNYAYEDMPDPVEIRTLVKDLWDIRMAKIRTSVDALVKEGFMVAKMDNLTMMEINSVRPLLPHYLDQLYRIRHQQNWATQSQNTTTFSLNTSSRT